MVVHMSHILCCPVAWILELRWVHCLLQTRPSRRVVWYFATLLSFYTYKGHGPLKICLRTPAGPWTPGWEPLVYDVTRSCLTERCVTQVINKQTPINFQKQPMKVLLRQRWCSSFWKWDFGRVISWERTENQVGSLFPSCWDMCLNYCMESHPICSSGS